jgi:hypothetical protein
MVKKLGLFLADPSNPKSFMFHKTRERLQVRESDRVCVIVRCVCVAFAFAFASGFAFAFAFASAFAWRQR